MQGNLEQVPEDQWMAEWQAGKILIMELAGMGDVIIDDDGEVVLDARRRGMDDVLDLSPLAVFIDRGKSALLSLAVELGLAEALAAATEAKIRKKFEDRIAAGAKVRPGYVDEFIKAKSNVLSDTAVLMIESALFDIAKAVREANDRNRKTAVRDDLAAAEALEVIGGRLKKRRKPRRRKEKEVLQVAES
jgi:hypothetical protein